MRRRRPYVLELEILDGKRLVMQRTATVHASSPDEAVAQVCDSHISPHRLRIVGIDVDPEPDADAACGASPLEPRPTLGARAG